VGLIGHMKVKMAVHPVDGGPSRPDALKDGPVPSGPADGRDPAVPSRPSQKTDGPDYKEHWVQIQDGV